MQASTLKMGRDPACSTFYCTATMFHLSASFMTSDKLTAWSSFIFLLDEHLCDNLKITHGVCLKLTTSWQSAI